MSVDVQQGACQSPLGLHPCVFSSFLSLAQFVTNTFAPAPFLSGFSAIAVTACFVPPRAPTNVAPLLTEALQVPSAVWQPKIRARTCGHCTQLLPPTHWLPRVLRASLKPTWVSDSSSWVKPAPETRSVLLENPNGSEKSRFL